MYSTCIYCRAPLGKNEVIEQFPVGRRLAFDAGKGRLWVVCASCARWNLTPVEERWEAIEECERTFAATPQRMSSGNIGLGRAREGLELVRIGQPLRGEFAAWRYGGEVIRRWSRFWKGEVARTATNVAGIGLIATLSPGAPVTGMLLLTWGLVQQRVSRRRNGRPGDIVANVEAQDGSKLAIRRGDLGGLVILRDKVDRWGLRMHTDDGEAIHLVDGAAIRVASIALAAQNADGASKAQVERAVATLEEFGNPTALLKSLPAWTPMSAWRPEQLLALEMATHEESERRALEGELHELELAWKDAEEIASIADSLFLPASVTDWLRKHRP